MAVEGQAPFRHYLRSIPDELLDLVSEDCDWLAGILAAEPAGAGYRARLALCREERSRRPSRKSRVSVWSGNPAA